MENRKKLKLGNWPFEKGKKAKLIWIGEPFKHNNKWMIDTYFNDDESTKKGLNIKDLTSKTTEKELEKIEQKLHKFILSDDIKKQNQNYKLTKKGFLRTDYIISELFL